MLEFVKSWSPRLDVAAADQVGHFIRFPHLVDLCLMADAHPGYGVPVGSVLVTEECVVPSAIGVDIGCGVRTVVLDLSADDIGHEVAANCLRELSERLPVGFNVHGDDFPPYDMRLIEAPEGVERVIDGLCLDEGRIARQLGTLGGGNHFVEIPSTRSHQTGSTA